LNLPLDEDLPNDPPADEEVPASQLRAESDAMRKGWLPKDQYKGDPKTWVDATTFLDRGDKFNKNLQAEVNRLKLELKGQGDGFKKLAKFYQESLDAKDSQLQSAITALRTQRSEAQADGDHNTVVQIEDRIDLLKGEQKKLKDERLEADADAADTGKKVYCFKLFLCHVPVYLLYRL
jgi:uncharacterized small protein (DUF1192 family)